LSEKKGMPFKIVIDTNIWVSYFINARTDYLVGWIIDHPVEVYTSIELADEIEEVLSRPKFKKQFPFPIKNFIHLHKEVCTIQNITRHYDLAPDPDDNFLFDLCRKVNADFLITSDKKLLTYSPSFPLEIITFNGIRSKF
jgi:putative PIN family toxin of toxin-antitoxin system